MEVKEGNERVCGDCEFWALLWDVCWDASKHLGVCRKRRLEWQREFIRENRHDPTPLDWDDFLYENICEGAMPGCDEWEEAE